MQKLLTAWNGGRWFGELLKPAFVLLVGLAPGICILDNNSAIRSILFVLRGLSHERQNPDLYNYLRRARLAQGFLTSNPLARNSLYQAALDAFWKGRSRAPCNENFALELGYTYDALERFPEAEWLFAEARAWDPRSNNGTAMLRGAS